MSKQQIADVCTLAAHLAQRQEHIVTGIMEYDDYIRKPAQCAADAMALQRLGRSARNLVKRGCGDQKARDWVQRIVDGGNTILKPYGLGCCFDFDEAPHFFVVGLPGNGADPSDGYGI